MFPVFGKRFNSILVVHVFIGDRTQCGVSGAMRKVLMSFVLVSMLLVCSGASGAEDEQTLRVFIFAGQSNMEGADSHVDKITNFPPFHGLDEPLADVRYSYNMGRNDAHVSNGWVKLQSVNNWVGPELSFAREIRKHIKAPVAIIKCAVGGTTLGEDWNPDQPGRFELYPKALKLVKDSLAELDQQGTPYRIEGVMWHQGENDMFNDEYRKAYGDNLTNFIKSWRRDLGVADLRFYIGELHCKSVWGMDNRQRMYELSQGQKAACARDPLVQYIPNNHNGMTIDKRTGLHYHFGTLGQLGHGMGYAQAYLANVGKEPSGRPALAEWPYPENAKIKLYVLAGHRNMEGERAFTQEINGDPLLNNKKEIAFRYSIGGGVSVSNGWEALGPAGFYDTFGPELSFAHQLSTGSDSQIAIAKFTHSGSQILDWTPEGSIAKDRDLYKKFIAFVEDCVGDLKDKGHDVELSGIVYHMGENDMCIHGYKKNAVSGLASIIKQSRVDLDSPDLQWLVSLQAPFPNENLSKIDVRAELRELAANDVHLNALMMDDDFPLDRNLLMNASGVKRLGELLAQEALAK